MQKTKLSTEDGPISEIINEDEMRWQHAPIKPGTAVTVAGRREAGDVAALTNVAGTVKSHSFSESSGNTYNVSVDGILYANIAPDMLTPS